jgi:hypothetical protein
VSELQFRVALSDGVGTLQSKATRLHKTRFGPTAWLLQRQLARRVRRHRWLLCRPPNRRRALPRRDALRWRFVLRPALRPRSCVDEMRWGDRPR